MTAVVTARGTHDATADLVNRLAQELAQVRRDQAAAARKLGATARALEGRTQELTEARAALSLLLATLECTSDGVVAMGFFGRAMHFNSRFIQMWGIPADKVAALTDASLLAIQLAQVVDADAFVAAGKLRKAHPDGTHASRVVLRDGRIFECEVVPQRVGGKRTGWVTRYQDVTARVLLEREVTLARAAACTCASG